MIVRNRNSRNEIQYEHYLKITPKITIIKRNCNICNSIRLFIIIIIKNNLQLIIWIKYNKESLCVTNIISTSIRNRLFFISYVSNLLDVTR